MRDRLSHLYFRYGDAVLGAALALGAIVQIAGLDEPAWARLTAAVAAAGIGVAAAFRVRAPLVLLALYLGFLVLGALLPKRFGDIEAMGLFFVLATYSGGTHTGGRRAILAGALTTAIAVVWMATDPDELNISAVTFFLVLAGAPWLFGRIVRARRLNEKRLEQEKAEAEAAIAEERSRIARELHDVVAHAISVIVLQARGGRRLLDEEPEETRGALDAIERTASQALDEMRRLVGLLRDSDEQLALAPQPSMSRLDALVSDVEKAGLPVELHVEGEPAELPPGVDLSAYRIVQEALTNALKHAGPARARVVVRYSGDEIELEISDDGAGSGNGGGAGQGLAGIRERAAVFGGDVEAGSRPEGGYAVRARLPYSSAR